MRRRRAGGRRKAVSVDVGEDISMVVSVAADTVK
jgi:hypothetical protein